MEKSVKVALLGCGTVGSAVARLLSEQADILAARAGARLELVGILVNDLQKERHLPVDPALFTTDALGLIKKADIVIELIGGIDPPHAYVRAALENGASVVTGNKALLATHGPELYELAAANDVDLYYEAAVAGAVPVVYGLRESLAGDRVQQVLGIMNGTTNFILDQMHTTGADFSQALAHAQELGFAEADPSADIDGLDAGAKIAILASLAFHTRVRLDDVEITGIRDVTAEDIKAAEKAGYVIKLIAAARIRKDTQGQGGIEASVAPTLVPKENPLATVSDSFNAVMIEAESADRLMFYGRGAGGAPTASAVLSDLVAAAGKRVYGGQAPREIVYGSHPILAKGDFRSRYYIKLQVADRPGVLAEMASIFAQHNVSLSTVSQEGQPQSDKDNAAQVQKQPVEIIFITHMARRADIDAAVVELNKLAAGAPAKVLQVEDK